MKRLNSARGRGYRALLECGGKLTHFSPRPFFDAPCPEVPSRKAASQVVRELYNVEVQDSDFIPFRGKGEAFYMAGVAAQYGITTFDVAAAKARFFEIYIETYAVPGSGLAFPGGLQLIRACRAAGLKVALASAADRVKAEANLCAAGIPLDVFDAVVTADGFARLKPAPDAFLAAAAAVGVAPARCVVIEDAAAGVQVRNLFRLLSYDPPDSSSSYLIASSPTL